MTEPVMHRFAAQTTDGKGYSGRIEYNESLSVMITDAIFALRQIGVSDFRRLFVLYEGGKTK